MSNNSLFYGEAITEDDIHAYVDGLLTPARRAEVEAFLACHPEEAERVEAYRAQNIALHRLFDGPPGEPLPLPLEEQAEAITGERERLSRSRSLSRVAAGLAILVLGGSTLWYTYDQFVMPEDPLVAFTRRASDAHMLLADRAYSQQASGSSGNVVGWLAQTLTGAPLGAPDLADHGFELVAQRILPTETGPAAQLLYRGRDGNRISLYVGASSKQHETAFTFMQRDDVSQFYWQNAGFAYSLIGYLERDELLHLAESISSGLTGLNEPRQASTEKAVGIENNLEAAEGVQGVDEPHDSASLDTSEPGLTESTKPAVQGSSPADTSDEQIIPVGTEPANLAPEPLPADSEMEPLPKESKRKLGNPAVTMRKTSFV